MKRILCLMMTVITIYVVYGSRISDIEPRGSSSIEDARSQLELFKRQASSGRPDAMGYQALHKACNIFIEIIDRTKFGSPEFEESRQALKEIFPRLADGAYFYAALNNQEKVLEFACAYVDVSLLECMDAEQFQRSPQYAVLANLAATNLYNRREYDRSIRYFSAYLESGDISAQENAFEGLARCYYETKQYGYAGSICLQGSQRYPGNMNILLIGIESCGHNGNDAEMEPMLKKALAIQPNHKGLLEYQGKMYERMQRYNEAASTFSTLYSLQPDNIEYTTHLGFNYFNIASIEFNKAAKYGTPPDSTTRKFELAAPYLSTVLQDRPYAANVARALAFCYSLTNNGVKLSEVNKTLTAMHSKAVEITELPHIEHNYTPSPDISTGISNSLAEINVGDDNFRSDVDINIPVTGRKNPSTYVLILANENYKNTEVSSVPFAHRDGVIFKEYCHKVIGVPDDHIKLVQDATATEMRTEVKNLLLRTDMEPDKLNIIFYYAGHGTPDPLNKKQYLVPVDVRVDNFEECYDLQDLYDQFDAMKAKNVTVFLDACFSGDSRTGQKLMAGSRFAMKNADDMKPPRKTVVFAAASANEAANTYKKQKHGYFTYFLLKALQETQGNITYAQLSERLKHDVMTKAFDQDNKKQTPTLQCPPDLEPVITTRKLID